MDSCTYEPDNRNVDMVKTKKKTLVVGVWSKF